MKMSCFYIIFLFLFSSCFKHEVSENQLIIATSCLKTNNKIKVQTSEAIEKGYSCLNKINPKKAKSFRSDFILLNNPLKITCTSNLDNSVFAIANSPKLNKSRSRFIELNINKIDNLESFERTFFHELLHLDGTKHFESIDYPYACEFHCFANKQIYSDETIQIAKRICRGDYKDVDDLEYILAISKFFIATTDDIYQSVMWINKYIMKSKTKKDLMILFAESLIKNESNFVAHIYIKEFMKKYGEDNLSNTQIETIDNLLKISTPKLSNDLFVLMEKIGSSFFSIHNLEKGNFLDIYDRIDEVDESKLVYIE